VIVAVDPGAAHCGVAISHDGETCFETFTYPPRVFEDWLYDQAVCHHLDLVVYEGYRIYPWAKDQQTWSRVETVEVIGALLFICRLHGVEVKEQLPPIKKPTEKVAPRLGWEFKGGDRHARDAELHLAHHLLRLAH
jgi:hypothetical protein